MAHGRRGGRHYRRMRYRINPRTNDQTRCHRAGVVCGRAELLVCQPVYAHTDHTYLPAFPDWAAARGEAFPRGTSMSRETRGKPTTRSAFFVWRNRTEHAEPNKTAHRVPLLRIFGDKRGT